MTKASANALRAAILKRADHEQEEIRSTLHRVQQALAALQPIHFGRSLGHNARETGRLVARHDRWNKVREQFDRGAPTSDIRLDLLMQSAPSTGEARAANEVLRSIDQILEEA